MEQLQIHLDNYIQTKKYAWATTTIKATQATLQQNLGLIEKGPQMMYEAFNIKYSKYSLVINWNRIVAFVDYLLLNSDKSDFFVPKSNEFKTFMTKNRRLFKNAYVTEKIEITYKEAEAKLVSLPQDSFRDWALFLLRNGLRYTESLTQDDQGQVIGKGNKSREILFPLSFSSGKWAGHYTTFYRRLKAMGLKPHTLRKLAATRALEKGATLPDICQIFGWSNIQTAARYLQPQKMNELRGLLR